MEIYIMRFHEISEANMGDKILLNPKLPENLTIGFEAEVIVDKDDLMASLEDDFYIDEDEIRENMYDEY